MQRTLSFCVSNSLKNSTQDLEANPRCSLLVPRDLKDKSDTTITLIGDAERVSGCVCVVCGTKVVNTISKLGKHHDIVMCMYVLQVSSDEEAQVRAAYLKKLPNAFWVRADAQSCD